MLLKSLVSPGSALELRRSRGAPHPREVRRMISLRKRKVAALRGLLSERKLRIEEARERLMSLVGKYTGKTVEG
jgi:hypothetical protein